jgi:beta-galactosidase
MILGVCYYPEQWPEDRWAMDAQMMAANGLTVVRIAEFAWARMEPARGRTEWAWLDRAITVLADAGLQVMLGTPTATPPAWLTQRVPAMLHVDANGRARRHGSRRQACVNNPVYRAESARIVRAMGERYGHDPRIVGWQIDNEFGGGKTGRCYCAACATGFRVWLQARYGSLAALNEAWGTVFWSQTYSDWSQVQLPDAAIDKPNPSQVLDFYRFSSDSFVDYAQMQVDCLRPLTPGFITTNFMGLFRDLDQFDLAQPFDFVTWDNYPTGNPDRWRSMLYPFGQDTGRDDPIYAYDVGDAAIVSMAHALTRALKDAPFWIMEQQCGLINWGDINPGIRAGTTRLWTWHALAEGAEACVYFRWRPTLFAQEQYHSGLLRHDGDPAQGLLDVVSMQPERDVMAAIAAQPFEADVALLMDFDDLWALELQPQRRGFGYLRHLFVYYRELLRLGVPVNLVPYSADLSAYKLVLAPTIHLPDTTLVERLTAYVTGGGRLLLGVRSGLKTPTNLVTDQPLPGLLRALAGARVTTWQSLPDEVAMPVVTRVPDLGGGATVWYETLLAELAAPLGHYESGEVAMAANQLGAGQVVTLGWYPDPEQTTALLRFLLAEAGVATGPDLPEGVLLFVRGNYTILLNFTDFDQTVTLGDIAYVVPPRDVMVLPAPDG